MREPCVRRRAGACILAFCSTLFPVVFPIAFFGIVIGGWERAGAFVRSDEELMEASIKETRARAHDFHRYRERAIKMNQERESAASEILEKRRRGVAAMERARSEFVRRRDQRPSQEAWNEKMEREAEEQRNRESAAMEKARLHFLRMRARVIDLNEREARIDEAEEYGLTQPPPPPKTGKRN